MARNLPAVHSKNRIGSETKMIGTISLISILLGGALAYAADRHPRHIELLEGSGGALLVAGLALLGSGLSQFH